jgi:hypothetical protein
MVGWCYKLSELVFNFKNVSSRDEIPDQSKSRAERLRNLDGVVYPRYEFG